MHTDCELGRCEKCDKEQAVIEAAKARHELIYDITMEATNGEEQAFAELLGEAESALDAALDRLQELEE